jgi:branched-chain amino acid transport system ATP-binding protein
VIGAYLGKGGDVVNAGREVMLRLEDVQTFYGPIQALKGISLEVREGEIVTLIGANGAGKSTTLRSITGSNRRARGRSTSRKC